MAEESGDSRTFAPVNWPIDLTPFQRTTCEYLLQIPSMWMAISSDKLSNAQNKAVGNLVRAGLVEARIIIESFNKENATTSFSAWGVSGDYTRILPQQLRRHFGQEEGKSNIRFRYQKFDAIRLTSHGESARNDLTGGHPFESGPSWWVIFHVAGLPDESGAPMAGAEANFISEVRGAPTVAETTTTNSSSSEVHGSVSPGMNMKRIQASMDYSTAEIISFFETTTIAAELVGTPSGTQWGCVIAMSWLQQSRKHLEGVLLKKGIEEQQRCYIEMAKLKSGVNKLSNPNPKPPEISMPIGKSWTLPINTANDLWKERSYIESPEFKLKMDELIVDLSTLRISHDKGNSISDYRTASKRYRTAVESTIDRHFPGMSDTYVLKDGVPLELRDKVYDFKTRLIIRLLGIHDDGDGEKFLKEAYLLHDLATKFGDINLPKVPSADPPSLGRLYDYATDLLTWCERGGIEIAKSGDSRETLLKNNEPVAPQLPAQVTIADIRKAYPNFNTGEIDGIRNNCNNAVRGKANLVGTFRSESGRNVKWWDAKIVRAAIDKFTETHGK